MDVTPGGRAAVAAAAIARIWVTQRPVVMGQVASLEAAVTAQVCDVLDPQQRSQAIREAHKLAGSLGTFGYPEGSELAFRLERILETPGVIGVEDTVELAEAVTGLRDLLDAAVAVALPVTADSGVAPADRPARVLLLVSAEAADDRLAVEAARCDLQLVRAGSPGQAATAARAHRPDVVLLDLASAPDEAEVTALLAVLAAEPAVPVVALAGSTGHTERLRAARLGARTLLQKPAAAAVAVAAAVDLLGRDAPAGATVVVVDDDPGVLAAVAALVRSAGLRCVTVDRPEGLWEALAQTAPDLVILDVDLPGASGPELCTALRSDPRWRHLPVLFLTAQRDPEIIQRVFDAGADDFVSKPVVGAELVARIQNRLLRSQRSRQAAETDAHTGLRTEAATLRELSRLLSLSRGHGDPTSVALVAVDRLPEVGDRHGQPAADAVLRRLGELCRQRLPGDGVVGRWSSHGLLFATYGAAPAETATALTAVLDELSRQAFTGDDAATFTVTGRSGAAHYPGDGSTPEQLTAAAQAGLERGADAAGAERGATPPAGELLDVVVVEDDDVLAELLVHNLTAQGYSVRRFADGADALSAFAGDAPLARLVLLDVNLPGVDGLRVLHQLAARGVLLRTSVMMLTARGAESEIVQALELGAVDHVTKPFSLPVLLQRVRRCLAERPATAA